ncbi:MAG: hypothetical protein AAF666_08845 [Pseudomonadota bacterium]
MATLANASRMIGSVSMLSIRSFACLSAPATSSETDVRFAVPPTMVVCCSVIT